MLYRTPDYIELRIGSEELYGAGEANGNVVRSATEAGGDDKTQHRVRKQSLGGRLSKHVHMRRNGWDDRCRVTYQCLYSKAYRDWVQQDSRKADGEQAEEARRGGISEPRKHSRLLYEEPRGVEVRWAGRCAVRLRRRNAVQGEIDRLASEERVTLQYAIHFIVLGL